MCQHQTQTVTMIFQAHWGLFARHFVKVTKSMDITAVTSLSQVHPKGSEILKSDKMSAMVEEEIGYESDSSDALWMCDVAEHGDREQSQQY